MFYIHSIETDQKPLKRGRPKTKITDSPEDFVIPPLAPFQIEPSVPSDLVQDDAFSESSSSQPEEDQAAPRKGWRPFLSLDPNVRSIVSSSFNPLLDSTPESSLYYH